MDQPIIPVEETTTLEFDQGSSVNPRNEEDKLERNPPNESGDDDDDFGDFEEAPHVEPQKQKQLQQEIQEKRPESGEIDSASSSGINTYQYPNTPSSPLFYLEIPKLAKANELWECQTDISTEFASLSRPTPPNLFTQMDTGLRADTRQLEEDDNVKLMLKAYRLWTQICYVEEAHALQFRWDSSMAYQRQLYALQLQQQKSLRPMKKFPHGKHHSKQQQREDDERLNANKQSTPEAEKEQQPRQLLVNGAATTSDANVQQEQPPLDSDGMANHRNSTPSPVVDSLMVPPADFDWRSSGLANPLTGKAVSAAAATPFDCSFLVDGQKSASSAVDSLSILEKDLQALGIISAPTPVDEITQTAKTTTIPNGKSIHPPALLDVGQLDSTGMALTAAAQKP